MRCTQHVIHTPLGDLRIQVAGARNAVITVVDPEIQLPPGMSVAATVAVLIEISALEALAEIRCECAWDSSPSQGDPESGECLDAQSWEGNGYRVTIGTEDFEALSRRLPVLKLTEAQYPVIYMDRGLAIEIPRVSANIEFSVHFVVSWRALPDPHECATWFAVDIPHEKLKEANNKRCCRNSLSGNL